MYRVKSNAVWHNLPGVVAAYQPIAAPDSLAARQNVAHGGARFGVYTGTPGVLPTWNAATGWTFNGTSQYLDTRITPSDGTWSYIVRFTNAQIDAAYQGIFGLAQSGKYVAFNNTEVQGYHGFYNGASVLSRSASFPSGILGIAGRGAYENGLLVSSSIPAWSSAPTIPIWVGAINGNPWANCGSNTTITVLIASRTFSVAEMWLASRQMAYCERNPDWNAWARRRNYYYAPQAAAGVDELTAEGVTTGAPAFGTPALSQIHALSGISISTGAPALGAPALTQVHALTATEIATGTPTLGTPVAAETHALTATGVATGSPTLGTPAIAQVHALTATGIATGAPVLGTPAITQVHALTATGIATGTPTLGTPVAAETHALTATGVATGSPTLGTPAIAQVHALTAPALDTTAPSLALPVISQLHVLVAMIIATGAATVGNPYLAQGLMVAPSSRTLSVPSETRSNNVAASNRTRTA